VGREVELKFDIEPGGAGRIARSEALAGATGERTRYETLYFDSIDGALRRAGYSLRIRRSGDRYVQTIKRKKASSAGLFVRQEWEEEVPDFTLRADALKRTPLRRWAARAEAGEILPLIRSEITRSAWQIRHRGSRIEVVLDRGRICSGDSDAPIGELELELIRGRPSALFDLARHFGELAPLRIGVLSKSERGYALAEGRLDHNVKAERAALTPPVTEAAAFAAVAFACLRHFRLNEIVLLVREDPEALHQARVALRRLRSAMKLFRPTLHGKQEKELREELRWFARHFGDARNLDLLLARLEADKVEEAVLAPLRDAHAKAHRRIARALRSARARAMFLELIQWIETGGWRGHERASHDLADLAVRQLEKNWKRVAKKARDFDEQGPEERHELRIAIKAMRYSAEFLAPLYGDRPVAARRDKFIGALKTLQDGLGDLNDAWTAEQMAKGLPGRLRDAIVAAHPPRESKKALAAASKALDRADAAAGYWREAASDA